MHSPRKLALITGTAYLLTSQIAHADFETLTYGAEPLPYALAEVKFTRADRREAVLNTIRTMSEALMRHSKAFRNKAPSSVTIELLDIQSSSIVQPDGDGVGRYSILYRVTTQDERVIFNDRIQTTAKVALKDAVNLKQSSARASRYRAFSQNIQHFLWALGKPQTQPVVKMRPMETPERTKDFQALAAKTIASLTSIPTPGDLTYKISTLNIRQIPSKAPDVINMQVETEIALTDRDNRTIWTGLGTGKATTSEAIALQNGINPVDASIAAATQKALRQAMRTVSSSLYVYSRDQDLKRSVHVPFSLTELAAKPRKAGGHIDRRALKNLKIWSSSTASSSPVTTIWQEGAPEIQINVQNLTTEIQTQKKTKQNDAEAIVRASYEIMDSHGNIMMITQRVSSEPIKSGATNDETDWALRVALLENWTGFLKQLQTLAPSPKGNKDTQ